ncbi:MAG: polysaccharide export protein [Thiothrix sp.]|nr:polysaccharide export protein [Thiothrix sp.]HPQ97683.1 polysaccharide biosynthesis/export family protein [Thiolinea sp.]
MHDNKKLLYCLACLAAAALLPACSSPAARAVPHRGGPVPASPVATVPGSRDTARESGAGIFSDPAELNRQPVVQEYRIGPSDLLDIQVFRADEFSRKVRVDQRGNISLPMLGVIPVQGLTQIELEHRLEQLLLRYLQAPEASVFIDQAVARRVTVSGEVKKSGVFPLEGNLTLSQAVALSEGLNTLADPGRTVLFRRTDRTVKAYLLNLDAIRNGSMPDPYLQDDDRIVIHRSDSRFWLHEVGTLLSSFRLF